MKLAHTAPRTVPASRRWRPACRGPPGPGLGTHRLARGSAALALGQRRDGHRRRRRNGDSNVHRHPELRGKSSVRYSTAQGTAASPDDFLSRTGRLKFAGGHRTNKVAITVVGDTLDESNETFFLRLSRSGRRDDRRRRGQGDDHRQRRAAFGLLGCHRCRPRRQQRRYACSPRSTSRFPRRAAGRSRSTT